MFYEFHVLATVHSGQLTSSLYLLFFLSELVSVFKISSKWIVAIRELDEASKLLAGYFKRNVRPKTRTKSQILKISMIWSL